MNTNRWVHDAFGVGTRMSASERSPLTSQVHQSIEQLIAETVRQSQSAHVREREALVAGVKQALAEIESSQLALERAATALRSALGDPTAAAPETRGGEVDEAVAPNDTDLATEETTTPADSMTAELQDRGPHELDVIAHGASIARASGLQALLRGREEVRSVQTREFVNGELRLHTDLHSALNMAALHTWLKENGGRVSTTTDAVVEISFAD